MVNYKTKSPVGLKDNSNKFAYILTLPFIIPIVDVGFGTILIFVVTLFVVGSHYFLKKKGSIKRSVLVAYLVSVTLLVVVVIVQNSLLFQYKPSDNNYIFRLTVFFVILCFSINFVVREFSSREEAFVDFTRSLFGLIVIAVLFEYLLRGLNLKPLLYFYKARQDLGGIDSVHYNRLSGFSSFPGDFAALVALCFVCVNLFLGSKTKLFILFVIMILTQSKAGIFLLLLFYSSKAILHFSLKGIITVLLAVAISVYIVNFFELEYYLRFLDNIEHYATSSKRAQEILFFFDGTLTEKLFGRFDLTGLYFESELFSSLNRNGIIGSMWFFIIYTFFILRLFLSHSKVEKDLILFLLVFFSFYCLLSAGFSRAKIGLFYIPFISIFFFIQKPVKDKEIT